MSAFNLQSAPESMRFKIVQTKPCGRNCCRFCLTAAPKEQPPRNLSGTRTVGLDDLERDASSRPPKGTSGPRTTGEARRYPRQMGINGRLRPVWFMSECGRPLRGANCYYWCRYYRYHHSLWVARARSRGDRV